MATLAPSRAARSAIARPMPREAPLMNRVLPFRLMDAPLTNGESTVGAILRISLWSSTHSIRPSPRDTRVPRHSPHQNRRQPQQHPHARHVSGGGEENTRGDDRVGAELLQY